MKKKKIKKKQAKKTTRTRETKKKSNTDPTCAKVHAKDKQFLCLIRNPTCYSQSRAEKVFWVKEERDKST